MANLAHIWAVAGDFARAISFLRESHHLLERDSQVRFATLSTGINVGLRSGNDAFADEMLQQGQALADVFPEDTYYSLWFALHRVTWLIYTRKFRDAANSAAEALKSIGRLADADLAERLTLLRCEALSLDGSQAEALDLFADVARGGTQPTLEVVAEIERVAAILRRDENLPGTVQGLAAARRILTSADLMGPKTDVERTARRLHIPLVSLKAAPQVHVQSSRCGYADRSALALGSLPKDLSSRDLCFS